MPASSDKLVSSPERDVAQHGEQPAAPLDGPASDSGPFLYVDPPSTQAEGEAGRGVHGTGLFSASLSPAGTTVLLSAAAMTIMAGAIIAPALPGIAEHFQVDSERDVRVKLLLTLPALVIAITAPIMGLLIDRFGRRPVLIAGFVLFGLMGSVGLVINHLDVLLATRIGLGISVAALVTVTNTLISDYFSGEARSRLIGRQSVFMSSGSIVFLVLGGFLATLGWRAPFVIYLAAFPMLYLALRLIPEPSASAALRGTAAHGGELDSGESGAPNRLLTPTVGWILLTAMVGMIVFYQIPVQMPFYLRQEFQASPLQAGFAIALSTLFSALLATRFSVALRRFGHGLVMAMAFCAMGAALSGLAMARTPAMVALSLCILGCGLGWLMPNLTAWMSHSAPRAARGRAMGLLGSSIFLGQFLAPVAATPLLASGGGFRELFAWMGMGATCMGMAYLAGGMIEVVRRR